jgi:carbonic anhydrase
VLVPHVLDVAQPVVHEAEAEGVQRREHAALIEQCPEDRRHDMLCELNVIEQVLNVGQTTVVRDAWERGQPLSIHGWIYRLDDGRLRDLKMVSSDTAELERSYHEAIGAVTPGGIGFGT